MIKSKDNKSNIKLWETEASQNIFWWQLDDIIKKVSPDIKYIKDTEQLKKKSEVDADNHIWPAWENVVYNLNQYQRTSPSWSDKLAAANSLNKAVEKYNEMLKKYWSNTSWWPMNDKWEYHWQDYARYIDNRYDPPTQYKYTVEWDKANAILNWWTYEKQEFKFKSKDWADLIKQINKLEKRYNELEELEKKVWPKWNSLKEQWKWSTKEAKQYLNQRFEYDNEKTKIINSMRQAEDDYRNLVDNYSKNGK